MLRRPAETAEWWTIFDPRCSLRARAALWSGGVMLGFTLLVAWGAGALLRRTLERQAGAHLETIAFQVSDRIDRALYERYRLLLTAATLDLWRGAASDPTGARRALESLLENSPDFAWLGLADPSGRVIVGTQRLFEGEDVSRRPWFLAAAQGPFFGTPKEFPELAREIAHGDEPDSNARFLELAVPLPGSSNAPRPILVAYLRWRWARDAQFAVFSEPSRTQRLAVTVYAANREVLHDSATLAWTQPPEPPAPRDAQRHRGFLTEQTANSTYLTGYARGRGVREYRGAGWITAVRQPAERAFAPVAQLRRNILLGGTALTILATSASWLVAGVFTRRLLSIARSAERIHEGDSLAVLPAPPGNSELETMCHSLNNLVEELRTPRSGTDERAPKAPQTDATPH